MNKLLTVLRRESIATLARETVLRTSRRWRQARFTAQLGSAPDPVEFRPLGYYRVNISGLGERSRALILEHADHLCRGEFSCLGYGSVQLRYPPDWNLDFISGTCWPLVSSQLLKPVRHDGSDVKVPWELSRLQFLPVLGKAWTLTREDRYRRSARELLSDWIEKNPVGTGINWMLAMEAALRAISMCLLLDLLSPFPAEESCWLHNVTSSLWQHLLFIEAHNEFSHFARGNHYLSNIVGLLCLSMHLASTRTEARRDVYCQLVEQEILHQVYEDGGHYEGSTGYHVLVTQMFTSALLLMKAHEREPAPHFLSRLRSMYRVLSEVADDQRRVPQLGDCDDGRVELLNDDLERMSQPPDQRDSLTIASLLGIGECLFSEDYRGRRDDVAWYRLDCNTEKPKERPLSTPRAKIFHCSGLAVGSVGEAEAIFLALPNGIAGKGSHTHNDKLSIILRIWGEEFLCDSGTYCYTRNANRRNHLRSTAAHNTVMIDGEEQNRFSRLPGALFTISDDAHVSAIEQKHTGNSLSFTASHDGYRRIGVKHTRMVTLELNRGVLIEDSFTGNGTHEFEASFYVPSVWKVQLSRLAGPTVSCRALGRSTVEMEWSAASELRLKTIPAEMSKAYGVSRMATRVVVHAKSFTPFELVTRMSVGG